MKILFLGDVMGRSGRHSLRDHLPQAITDNNCLLYTSPSPRDRTRSRMPSSA